MQTVQELSSYCRQAITTKFLSSTNHRGARIQARCDAHRITVAWDDAFSVTENHARAALALLMSLGWHKANRLAMGTPQGKHSGFYFVQIPI